MWFKAPFKILRLFVREKLRERVFTVSVPTLSLHVPRKALPIHLGGTLEIEHNTWLLHCRKSMTNREDELLANIGGLSATATATNTNQNNLIVSQQQQQQQQHITSSSSAGVVTNGDCQRFLAEPNENIQTPLTNGHHNNTTTTATLVPITNNTINNINSTITTNNTAIISPIINQNTSPIHHNNKLLNLTNGVTTPNGDINNITATTPTTAVALVNGTTTAVGGGGGGGVGSVCQTGLGDFWTENPPSSASSGFSDDDSLAGQEGDPKTIEQIVQMVKTLGRQGLVKEYAEIRSRAPDGTFLHAR